MCPGPVFGALESATRETEPGRESPHRQSVDDDTCGRIPTGAEVSVADGEPDETPQTSWKQASRSAGSERSVSSRAAQIDGAVETAARRPVRNRGRRPARPPALAERQSVASRSLASSERARRGESTARRPARTCGSSQQLANGSTATASGSRRRRVLPRAPAAVPRRRDRGNRCARLLTTLPSG